MFVLFTLLCFSFFPGVKSDDLYECSNQDIILDQNGYELHSKMMASSQNCILNFTWPSDYIAIVQVSASTMDYYDNVNIYSSWGQMIAKQSKESMAVDLAWPPSEMQVGIATIANTKMILTLIIHIQKFSLKEAQTTVLQTAKGVQPSFVQMAGWAPESAVIGQSASKVTASRASPSRNDERNWANVFVYDGSGDDVVFRGTLYSLNTNGLGLMSKGQRLTLYNAYRTNFIGTIIINDEENVKPFAYSQFTWSPYDQADINFNQKYLLDASKGGMGALTILNEADGSHAIYATKIEYLSDDATPVKLLNGGIVMDSALSTQLAEYTDSSAGLPQFVPGFARTFILEKGVATVSYTVVEDQAHYEDAINGRSGFIMSNNYPFQSLDQDSTEFRLKSVDGKTFKFILLLPSKNPNQDAYLNISLLGEPAVPDNQQKPIIYSLNQDIPYPRGIDYTATDLRLTINGGKAVSSGCLLTYTIVSTAENPSETEGTNAPGDIKTSTTADPRKSTTTRPDNGSWTISSFGFIACLSFLFLTL